MAVFKVGDVVELKSGGPDMTIAKIIPPGKGRDEEAYCRWFDGNELKSGVFELPTLKYIEGKSAD